MIREDDYKEKFHRARIVMFGLGYYGIFLTLVLIFLDNFTKLNAIVFALIVAVLVTFTQYYILSREANRPQKVE